MVRVSLTAFTLLSLTRRIRANETVDSEVLGIFRFYLLSCGILFWSIFCIPLLVLELSFAFHTLNQITHFSDCFIRQILKLRIPNEPSNLVLHHRSATSNFQTPQIASLVHKFRINVFVDARHTEDVPAVVNIEENVSVKIFIILPLAVRTVHNFSLIDSNIRFRFVFHLETSSRWI